MEKVTVPAEGTSPRPLQAGQATSVEVVVVVPE
jgi:hypothetical protein